MRLFMYPYCRDKNQHSARRAARVGHIALIARIALIATGMLAAHAAQGQASASVSLASEYSVRGVSLSAGRPSPQLSLAYDAAQGWYAGAFAASGLTLGGRSDVSSDVTQLVAYGGYARRLASGLSWEAGASSTGFQHASEYNYGEIYFGLASDRISGRVYLAPAYYGRGGRAAYGELNGFYPLREHLKLLAHIGALHAPAATARDRVDLRLAIGYDSGDCNVQLAWLASNGRGDAGAPRALSLSATYSF
jgi:uncharacterized protein (TIGR02001 family)